MGKPVTDEEIINKCNELGMELVEIKRGGHETRVLYICPKHRNKGILDSTWGHFKKATYGCKYCAGKDKTLEDFLSQIGDVDYEIISDYIGFEKPITCRCKICGNIWTTTPKSLWQKYGCPECGKVKRGLKKRKTHEQFIEEMAKENPNIKIRTRYTRQLDPVECECLLCGNVWESKPVHLLYQHVMCPRCTASKMEVYLGETLSQLGYTNIRHHVRFADCKYKHQLEFDYVIYDDLQNIIFACEYDGEGHYKAIDFAGKGQEFAEQQLKLTQERDMIKDEYCIKNNICLIRVPYWERENMCDFLKHQIKINNIIVETVETAG